jgi:3D (Asp-Asp-Asp) domain-containing protein
VAPGTWSCVNGLNGNWVGNIVINSDLTGSYSPPYCSSPLNITVQITGSNSFDTRNDSDDPDECVGANTQNSFSSGCRSFNGQWDNDDGTSGPWTCNLVGQKQVSITASKSIIPSESEVVGRKVLTQSTLTMVFTNGTSPISGASVPIESSRPSVDTIINPDLTDGSGEASADDQTRDQSGPSIIDVNASDISTVSSATITWLPAHYEDDFLVTCYVVSLESDFQSSALIGPVNGLPVNNKYHRGFIDDVKLQGSGIALDGSTIHFDGGSTYSIQSCPLTATNVCAVDGVTAAVDFKTVPRRGTISINTVGSRVAQDTGGAIIGTHIDEYFGTRRAACKQAGRRILGVDFSNY